MVLNQDRPFASRLGMTNSLPGTSVHQVSSCFCLAEGISAGIKRVGEDSTNIRIDRQLPNHLALSRIEREYRSTDFLFGKPQQDSAHTPQLGHLAKNQFHCLLHTLIRMFFYFAARCPTQTHGKKELQFAAASLLADCLLGALPQQTQFGLTHSPLHPKKQTIIHDIRIVDSIEIHQDRSDHATQLDQMMPVAAVARQSRSLDAKDSACFAAAHLGHQTLESRALNES